MHPHKVRQREETMARQYPHARRSSLQFSLEKERAAVIPHAVSSLILALTAFLSSAPNASAANCAGTSVGFIPIDDLGPGVYQGFPGGLYPGGSDARPVSHEQSLDRVGRVMLLDAQGQPDSVNGKIVLMSVGMSNTTQEFSAFKPLADADPDKNSRLVIVDAAQGGQDAATISNPSAAYWSGVDQKLSLAGVTPLQVEAVWLKEARAQPTETFPLDAQMLRDQLRAIVQIIKSRYPNTRSVYLSSRTYAGYATSSLNPEPFAYQSGFSVKWLVEEQLGGSAALNFDPAKGPVMAPWLSWGSYLWADGMTPRSDGLTWACEDFRDTDGTHPSDLGRARVAGLLLDSFKSDPTTARWFVDCFPADPGTFAAPPEVQDVQVAHAGGGSVTISWDSLDPVVGAGAFYDLVTGSVSLLRSDAGFAGAGCLTSGLPDTPFTDSQSGPATGEAFYYLVRGRNGCGLGTYGDGTPAPDPRDLLDAGTPTCP
ncbi:MAG TPA: hypothetical protein VGR38_04970 [Candidatus Polarisedimenticolia bacterium]|jgi:hypothetical protein|nr:hypothetical protein [Candidatus Polarisedimenticolia bacterium]